MAKGHSPSRVAWFLSLPEKEFTELCRHWNNKNLDLNIPEDMDYDGAMDYLRSVSPNKLLALMRTGKDALPVESFSAVSRWHEIVGNPSKIEKIYKAKLAQTGEQDIMAVAVGDDDEEFYKALIQNNVHQLNSSSVSPQEAARLTSNINLFRKELKVIRSRSVKKGTLLANVLEAANKPAKKPTQAKKTPTKAKPKAIKPKDGKTTTRKAKT